MNRLRALLTDTDTASDWRTLLILAACAVAAIYGVTIR